METNEECFEYIIHYFIKKKIPFRESFSILSIMLINTALIYGMDFITIKETFNSFIDSYQKDKIILNDKI